MLVIACLLAEGPLKEILSVSISVVVFGSQQEAMIGTAFVGVITINVYLLAVFGRRLMIQSQTQAQKTK